MRVVYRMRGLLGDATEDMVNSLDSGKGLLFSVLITYEVCFAHYPNCFFLAL